MNSELGLETEARDGDITLDGRQGAGVEAGDKFLWMLQGPGSGVSKPFP